MTNYHSRLLYDDAPSALSIKDRLKQRLVERATAIEELRKASISEKAYLKACDIVSRLFDIKYMHLAQCLLPLLPDEEIVSNLQIIAQWEQHKHRDDSTNKYLQYMERMKMFWPNWKPSSAQSSSIHDNCDLKSVAGCLYGDALQSILMFLEPTELTACMLVSKSWLAIAKRPKVWKGKVLRIAEHAVPAISELYTAPWASLALRRVEAITVFATQPHDVFGNSAYYCTDCYNNLLNALRLDALPNLRRVCMLNNTASALAESLVGNPFLEEVVVGDNVAGYFEDRYSLLQNLPNLRVARIAAFHELNRYYGRYSEFCQRLAENTTIQHLIIPLEEHGNWKFGRKLQDLYPIVSRHPSLKTLEMQIYDSGPLYGVVANILKHCGGICDNVELLHIKQVVRPGLVDAGIVGTEVHLAVIREALLTTVLLERSKMHVKIELVAGKKTIKRYRKMLRELPAGAAKLAKERMSVSITTSPKKYMLFHHT
jgi:hypothetical protein